VNDFERGVIGVVAVRQIDGGDFKTFGAENRSLMAATGTEI